jgi:hypothetical protein
MWIAHYNDGTELRQFSEGRENLFKDIDQSKLTVFELGVDSKLYKVFLTDGSFEINGELISFENFGIMNEFELIYFRRVRQNIGSSTEAEVLNCVGWKTNIDGHCFRRILKISETGEVTLALR